VAPNRTDWEKLRCLRDGDILFTADAPQTEAEGWVDAVVHRGLDDPAFHAYLDSVLALIPKHRRF
jgi:hypothetical protein